MRDVIERHGVGNVTALKQLVNSIMNAPGSRFSINKFYNTLKSLSIKCTKNSLYDYLDHLLEAYLFYRVPVHSRSEKARLVNPAKIYAVDTGLLNAMTFRNSPNRGHMLENAVFMHLRRNAYQVEYVTCEKGYEADFLACHPTTGVRQLLQVCWDMDDSQTFSREVRGLANAMANLGIKSGTIVTWDNETELDNGIHVVPVWKWLLAPA